MNVHEFYKQCNSAMLHGLRATSFGVDSVAYEEEDDDFVVLEQPSQVQQASTSQTLKHQQQPFVVKGIAIDAKVVDDPTVLGAVRQIVAPCEGETLASAWNERHSIKCKTDEDVCRAFVLCRYAVVLKKGINVSSIPIETVRRLSPGLKVISEEDLYQLVESANETELGAVSEFDFSADYSMEESNDSACAKSLITDCGLEWVTERCSRSKALDGDFTDVYEYVFCLDAVEFGFSMPSGIGVGMKRAVEGVYSGTFQQKDYKLFLAAKCLGSTMFDEARKLSTFNKQCISTLCSQLAASVEIPESIGGAVILVMKDNRIRVSDTVDSAMDGLESTLFDNPRVQVLHGDAGIIVYDSQCSQRLVSSLMHFRFVTPNSLESWASGVDLEHRERQNLFLLESSLRERSATSKTLDRLYSIPYKDYRKYDRMIGYFYCIVQEFACCLDDVGIERVAHACIPYLSIENKYKFVCKSIARLSGGKIKVAVSSDDWQKCKHDYIILKVPGKTVNATFTALFTGLSGILALLDTTSKAIFCVQDSAICLEIS